MASSTTDNDITNRQADAQITRLLVMVEGITHKVSAIPNIEIDLAVMKKSFADKCQEIDDLDEIINGNGKPGMKDDVSHLKSRMSVLLKTISWAAGIIGGSLLAFTVSLWFYLITLYGQNIRP